MRRRIFPSSRPTVPLRRVSRRHRRRSRREGSAHGRSGFSPTISPTFSSPASSTASSTAPPCLPFPGHGSATPTATDPTRGDRTDPMTSASPRRSSPVRSSSVRSLPRRTPSAWLQLFTLAFAVLCLGGLAACGGEGDDDPESPEAEAGSAAAAEPARVTTEVLRPEAVTDLLSLPADLAPSRRAVLAAEVSGSVDSMAVDVGQAVSRGQALARVDSRALAQQVSEAEAVFRQADAQLTRARNLYERRSITQKDLLDAITNKDVAEARLASTRLELSKSRLTAPWAGRVAATWVEEGDFVAPGQPMVELVDTRVLEARASVPAADVTHVAEGVRARVRVSSLPGEVFEGTVARLGAELDQDSRTLALEVEIANGDGRLKPGMLARVEIPRQEYPEALLVPLDAVLELEDRRAVFVVEGSGDGERAERRDVEMGPILGSRVVVTSGLSAGDRVVVRGQSRIAPGQPVRAESREPQARGAAAVDPAPGDRARSATGEEPATGEPEAP